MINSWQERFWSKVDKSENCWNWKAGKFPSGYGSFWYNDTSYSAHTIAWRIVYGDIPHGLWVLHKCDNYACVRPEHLFLGTVVDNNRDMVNKNRQASGIKNGHYTHPECTLKGEQCWQAKLTAKQVMEIRAKYIPRLYGCRKLSCEYGVSYSLIYMIVRRKIWKSVN